LSTTLRTLNIVNKREGDEQGVLLTIGKYYGTLAAARCYGKLGVPVYLAESDGVSQTRWSRYVTRTVQAPPIGEFPRFVNWLLDFGRTHPGLLLYSTSDDMSWVLASRRDDLSDYYRLYQPPLRTIVSLLDKRHLYGACREVGIDFPETLFPDSDAALQDAVATVTAPVLIKPRTQMLMLSKSKGRLCGNTGDLLAAYRTFRADNPYLPEILAYDPTIAWPMLQRYPSEAMVDTDSLSGFIDETGEVFIVRAARKIFQRPRRLGVGLCFLGEPVNPILRRKIFDLCRHVGYFGAFESEFVRIAATGEHLLIDFNPRFYGQMGFEVARDMPLPAFVYWAARGLTGENLRAAVNYRAELDADAYHYSNRWILKLVMMAQTLSGRLSSSERQSLNRLLNDPKAHYVDAVRDSADGGPFLADIFLNLKHFARHPRDFYRTFFQDA
jgi:D-aspartate ligase